MFMITVTPPGSAQWSGIPSAATTISVLKNWPKSPPAPESRQILDFFIYNETNMDKIRTRFAPSPTGYMHVGGVRTALSPGWWPGTPTASLFCGWKIPIRSGSRRIRPAHHGFVKWLGLNWDEGPDKDGPFGPYRQSQRLDSYKHGQIS